ncbi:hypothetical protein JD844_005746 [Phrynosoma platyrhinos]|uniref:UPAR/Ly6 domain-containing protein n=1 Tax=Phrynosoma platyrhinos TaxID=52577 RepID=A0ABQ7TP11_PHRPL|nr:hypothetical protein JD844_005746 [Phrynosoma platyrhinos]
MKDVLGSFLLSVLLRMGSSLVCESCTGLATTCSGFGQTCDNGQDTCVVRLTESTVGDDIHLILSKGCASSRICKTPFSYMNLGHGKYIRSVHTCCKGEACNDPKLRLLPQLIEPNGKQCPACFSTISKCDFAMVACSGDENFCLDMIQESRFDSSDSAPPGIFLITMQAVLGFFLIFAFLRRGTSLVCEVCFRVGTSCFGPVITCERGQNTCAFLLIENTFDGIPVKIAMKFCASSRICKKPLQYLNIGQGRFERTSIKCCAGRACKKVSPQFPLGLIKPNGKQCYACLVVQPSHCGTAMVDCSGEESHCLNVVQKVQRDPSSLASPRMVLITKKAVLRFFLIFALLIRGNSLQCESCITIGTKCSGRMKGCRAGEDMCILVFIENTLMGGRRTQLVAKACASHRVCKKPYQYLNMGQGRYERTIIICCEENACKKATPKFPSGLIKPNGKQCPGCFISSPGYCGQRMVDCSGEETQCLDVVQNITIGSLVVTSYRRGCVTEALCSENGGTYITRSNTRTRTECTPASGKD